MDKPIDAYQLYREMVRDLHKSGLDAQGMWPAYLMGELRKARSRINELQRQIGDT